MKPEPEVFKEIKVIKKLLPFLGYYPWAVPLLVALGALASLAEGIGISLFIPFLRAFGAGDAGGGQSNWLVDGLGDIFAAVPKQDRLLVISACILGSVLLRAGLNFANTFLSAWLDARIGHRLRSRVFEQLLTVSFRFWDRCSSGKLLNVLSTETWRTCQALAVLLQLMVTLCTLAVYTALLLLISWRLTLLVAAVMVVISLIVHALTSRVKALGRMATQANELLAKRMIEGVSGIKVIRAFGREPFEQERFDSSSSTVSRVFMRLGIFAGVVNPVYEILAAALLVYILFTTLAGPADLPAVLVFIFVLYRLQPRVKALDAARVGLSSLAASVDEVDAMLDRTGKPVIVSGKTLFRGLGGDGIRLDDVTFRYDTGDKPALKNCTAAIPAGKTTAIVGPSGAGKSTLIKLILRFYNVTEGAIRAGGTPLDELDLSSWRGAMALVSQDVFIFNATVRENIAYGRLDASEADITAAAKQADAHGFIIELPQGYDTEVGERGVRLSGGQQQRITLARAIVRDPVILILDEATNALDSISERAIQKTLETMRAGRTVIVIAHRLSTIENADHIIVLDEGRVCGEGTFEELLRGNELFARIYELQYRNAALFEKEAGCRSPFSTST